MVEKLTKLALTSRVIILVVQFLANATIPNHKADVFRSPIELASNATLLEASSADDSTLPKLTLMDKMAHLLFGGLRHWDGEYFLHIAEHAYSYENTLAFYPLYPLLVGTTARGFEYIGFGLSLRSWNLLIAVVLNIFFFCKATDTLYNLTQRIFDDPTKSWNAALLFCCNPASIFFTAAYSETLFCWITFSLMLECVSELRFLQSTAYLALSVITRSNGIVNLGYPLYFMMRQLLLQTSQRFQIVIKSILVQICALLPLTFFFFYAFQQFCQPERAVNHSPAVESYARERKYILAGQRQAENSPWCDETLPFPYSYIQSHYWNVGFLRYYEFKQWPNFLLALPVLSFLYYHCYEYLHCFFATLMPHHNILILIKELKSFAFIIHALFLTIFCTFFVHIQISTRLLCSATPCLYWFAADRLPRTFDQIKLRSVAGMILVWFSTYCLLGTILFSNNIPWT